MSDRDDGTAAIETAMSPGERAAFANGFAAAGAELARLRAWAEDEQSKRHLAEEKLVDARGEIERLRIK
jgi:hypothetical protein